jgi:HK97 family phage portal protein
VQILATSVSNLGWQTKRYATGIELVVDNPTFVNNPSLNQTRHQFVYATVAEMALTGNAFWVKSLDGAGRVIDVTLLPSASVSVTLSEPNNLLSARVYNYLGRNYSAAEVEHLQLFPRAGWLKAPSPISICGDDIVAALDLRDYQANWFSSAGIPTGVLKTNKEISAADAEAITTSWHTKQATRQVAVLSQMEYDTIQLNPSEAMFTEQSAQAVQGIARLFGIPARKLVTGVDGTSDTYSNLTDEESAFFRETLQAYVRPLQDALSRCLPRGSRVEPLWEDLILSKPARIQMWADAIAAGMVTPEYAAEKEGFN